MTNQHESNSKTSRALPIALLACVLFAGIGHAQDKGPTIGPAAGAGGDDMQRELKQLFGKVETKLRQIDRLLSDAGAGDTKALSKVGPSGIDELLKSSKKSGEEALKDIDRILEIAREMGQQSSSSGSGTPQGQPQPGGGKPDGKSPLDKQDGNTTQREDTPSAPQPQGQDGQDKKPGGEKPDPNGKDPKNEPKPGGTTPNDNKQSNDKDPKNQKGGTPQAGAKDPAARTSDDKDRWGDLPQHAQDVFRSEGGRDMPVQYRDWIDAYYKRLNKKQP
jgi:hypothetical protein